MTDDDLTIPAADDGYPITWNRWYRGGELVCAWAPSEQMSGYTLQISPKIGSHRQYAEVQRCRMAWTVAALGWIVAIGSIWNWWQIVSAVWKP